MCALMVSHPWVMCASGVMCANGVTRGSRSICGMTVFCLVVSSFVVCSMFRSFRRIILGAREPPLGTHWAQEHASEVAHELTHHSFCRSSLLFNLISSARHRRPKPEQAPQSSVPHKVTCTQRMCPRMRVRACARARVCVHAHAHVYMCAHGMRMRASTWGEIAWWRQILIDLVWVSEHVDHLFVSVSIELTWADGRQTSDRHQPRTRK